MCNQIMQSILSIIFIINEQILNFHWILKKQTAAAMSTSEYLKLPHNVSGFSCFVITVMSIINVIDERPTEIPWNTIV